MRIIPLLLPLKDKAENKGVTKGGKWILSLPKPQHHGSNFCRSTARLPKRIAPSLSDSCIQNLKKLIRDTEPGSETGNKLELLRARCNILEALLIKYLPLPLQTLTK
ncbi:MAG: hypothetical protein MZU84_05045 [Sphingobacterium sp.]|nr:hypothetical protein [Sphingobacterium sp.]